MVEQLASTLALRDSDPKAAAAGLLVNTMGWVDGLGYDLLLHSIDALAANVIVVIGQDRLAAQLQQHFQRMEGVEVVKVAKSGGVVIRSRESRKSARDLRVKEYFYGPRGDLHAASQTIPANDLQIFEIGAETANLPKSALPIGGGKSSADALLRPRRAAPKNLRNRVLGVTYAKRETDITARCDFLGPCPHESSLPKASPSEGAAQFSSLPSPPLPSPLLRSSRPLSSISIATLPFYSRAATLRGLCTCRT